MPDNYTEFFEKLGEIDAAVRETERACVELPPTVAKELYNGAIYYMKADKEFSEGNEEKASEKLNRAVIASSYGIRHRPCGVSTLATAFLLDSSCFPQ